MKFIRRVISVFARQTDRQTDSSVAGASKESSALAPGTDHIAGHSREEIRVHAVEVGVLKMRRWHRLLSTGLQLSL